MCVQRHILLLMYAANQVAQHAMCSDVMDSETNKILPVAVQHIIFVALCHFVLQYVDVVIQLQAEFAKLVFLFQRLIEVLFSYQVLNFGYAHLMLDETVAFRFKM